MTRMFSDFDKDPNGFRKEKDLKGNEYYKLRDLKDVAKMEGSIILHEICDRLHNTEMSEHIFSTQNLDVLTKKLGHDLVEIRTRALCSIVSKLEYGLLHEADLVQERHLFMKLLEWFNFDPAPMKVQVFEIFIKLSCHKSACELLVSLGAVNFLTDLRPNISSSLKPKLDTVLDRLFHTTGNISDGRCTYHGSSLGNNCDITENQTVNSCYFESSDDIDVEARPQNEYCFDDAAGRSSFNTFSGFPWHFLTTTDRHVLTSTGSSLCSTNTLLVQNACSFLLDVVFRDFPVEIFLQRPSILNTLLTLLKSQPTTSLMFTTCECISYIAENLLSRIFYLQDPDLYCPRQGLPFQGGVQSKISDHNGIRQERHVGDGRDENSVSSQSTTYTNMAPRHQNDYDYDESMENEHTVALQLAQISPHHFALSALQTVFPFLLNDSASLFESVYEVALNCIQILSHILDSDSLWNCNSNSFSEIRNTISSLCENIGKAVLHHYHLGCKKIFFPTADTAGESVTDEWCQKYESAHDAVFHRVAFHACSMMAIRFLEVVLPVEKSNSCVKDVLSTALYVIACDEPLRLNFCEKCMVAEAYLKYCSSHYSEILIKQHEVTRSILHTYQFFDECKFSEDNLQKKLELAESSFQCLPYHNVEGLIFLIVELVAKICTTETRNSDAAQKILLQLLAHPLARVRSETYESCLKILTSNLNVIGAVEGPCGGKNNICKFLLSTSVLYEISLHGVVDTSSLVTVSSQDLLLRLLQSKMLFNEQLWQKFIKSVCPVMPVLQSCIGETKLIRDALFDFIAENFSFTEKISCLFRCLLIKQREVRITAGQKLQKMFRAFMQENSTVDGEDGTLHQLLQKTSCIHGVVDLLVIEKPISLSSSNSSAFQSNLFHQDVVVKMLSIFRSRSIELAVRRSALQQMSVILCNSDNIDIFIKSDGLLTIKLHFTKLASDKNVLTDPERAEADACVSILKSVILFKSDIRANLAQDPVILLALFRIADLCRLSCISLCNVVSTLTLLLFQSVALDRKTEKNSVLVEEISMPAGITSYYQMPFLCNLHHVVSENKMLIPQIYDNLFSGPAAFSVRIAAALSKNANDIWSTLQEYARNQERSKEISKERLHTLLIDTTALKYSVPETCLSELVQSLSQSNSHSSVRRIMCLLRIFMKANPLIWKSMLYRTDVWRVALVKFLTVLPSSAKDEILLLDISNMLCDFLSQDCEPLNGDFNEPNIEETVLWYLRICMQEEIRPGEISKEKPLFYLLKSSDCQLEQISSSTSSVNVRRKLCKSILSMLNCVSRKIMYVSNKKFVHRFQKEVCQILLLRLKLADAPQFYDLPSMEVTLECLLQNTTHFGWTVENDCTDLNEGAMLCKELIRILLEVVSAFHIESRGNSMSYMGKGVSRSATQCIVNLAIELAKNSKTFPLLHEWLTLQYNTSIEKARSVIGSGTAYDWMMPLWSARDPRIRLSGKALSVVLTKTTSGSLLLVDSFRAYMNGLWKASFAILFDDMECSAIRYLATALLCNLTSHGLPELDDILKISELMNNKISSETTTQVLVTFLHDIKFAQNIVSTISRYHSNFSIQPVTILYSPFTSCSTSTKNCSTNSTVDQEEAINHDLNTIEHSITRSNDADIDSVKTLSESQKSLEQDCTSANSYTSTSPSEWMSVSTPKLLTGVCRLLTNLVELSPKEMLLIMHQERLLEHLAYLIDVPVLMLYLNKLKSTSHSQTISFVQQLVTTKALLTQFTETCKLLHICSEQDKTISFILLKNSELVASIFQLLNVIAPFHPVERLVNELQESVMQFLSCIIQQNISRADDTFRASLLDELCLFSKSAHRMMSLHSQESLILSVVTLLSNIMNFVYMSSPIGNNFVTMDADFHNRISEGDTSVLCAAVIKIFEGFSMKSDNGSFKILCAAAGTLQIMFSFSISKRTAFDMGFFESLLEGIKQSLCTLEIVITDNRVSKGKFGEVITPKHGIHIVEKVIVYLKTLANFLWNSEEMKMSAWKSNIGNLITKLFKFTSIFSKLKCPLLKFTLCYTAASEHGCTSLSLSMPGHLPFVCNIIEFAEEFGTKIIKGGKVSFHNFHLTYRILVNLTSSQECRSLIWKSNFLSEFISAADKGQHPKCTKLQKSLLVAWLKLLHSLSFYKDGQNYILKMPDILEVIAGIAATTKGNSQLVLNILLNLCFHNSSKARISLNKTVVHLLMDSLSSKFQLTAITAIWVLLSNNQKSKVHLKVAGLVPKVRSVLMHINQSLPLAEHESLRFAVMAVLEIVET